MATITAEPIKREKQKAGFGIRPYEDGVPKMEDMKQVVIFNDSVNSFDHVIKMLVAIFKHTVGLATKIAGEAHNTGKAIAEVEGKEEAELHKQQLESAGITAEVQEAG